MPYSNGQYKANEPLIQFLSDTGSVGGVINAIGDYSVTPKDFYITPPVGMIYYIEELLISYVGTGNYQAQNYANGPALTNGVRIQYYRGATLVSDITDGVPLITNGLFGTISTDYNLVNFAGLQTMVSISFESSIFKTELILSGDLQDKLVVHLNDDFTTATTGLLYHHFKVSGFK